MKSHLSWKWALFLFLMYFPIFLHLDYLPIRLWDEARLAANAWETHKDGNYLVTHFSGEPDMWNTKPPLMIWIQALFIKIFGIGELAIRLPSAIAALLTCVALVLFSLKYLKDFWFGLIASLILVTSSGYINVHVTRTGDYDALLVLFMTLYALFFFAFTETNRKSFLHLFFAVLTLAVLTKSIQGLLFTPALFAYALIQKKWTFFKTKWLLIDGFAFMLIIGAYYFFREQYNPGYLKAVWENELGGRYLSTLEDHKAGFFYYAKLLVKEHYSHWLLLFPLGILAAVFSKDERMKRLCLLSTLLVTCYWLIISSAQTKLEWYHAPLFPFLALIGALFIYSIFRILIAQSKQFPKSPKYFLPIAFLCLVFAFPYQKIIEKVFLPKEFEWDKNLFSISYFLQDAAKGKEDLQGYKLCYGGYAPQVWFYVNVLKEKGKPLLDRDWHLLQAGEKIIAAQADIQQYIEENYAFEILGKRENIKKYLIGQRKVPR